MDWVSIVASLIKLLASLTTYFQQRGWVAQGATEESQRQLQAALDSIAAANNLRTQVSALTPEQLDQIAKDQGWLRKD